jgi:hypothetical protein
MFGKIRTKFGQKFSTAFTRGILRKKYILAIPISNFGYA